MDLLAWMEQWNMLPREGGTILCALSGGRDSVCLLHYLEDLSARCGFSVAAAHFNHQMRPTALRDEEFTRELCCKWGIPLSVGQGDVYAAAEENGWSAEEAARKLRYDFLEKTAQELGAERIATAHHREDQAETVLLNLLRGTGPEGLGGIPPVRGKFIRPLLQTSRDEIDAYIAAHRLPYMEDETNQQEQFTRNRLRLRLWPQLEEIHPGASSHIVHTAQILREENRYLNTLAAEYLPAEGAEIACDTLLRAPEVLRMRIVRLLLQRTEAGGKDFGAVHYEAVVKLAGNGGMLDLPGGICAVCRQGRLSFVPKNETLAGKTLSEYTNWGKYTIYQRKQFGNFSKKEDTILLNCDKINQPIQVRAFESSDRLTLPGSRGSRSIKRLLAERGIPAEERRCVPVFCVGERPAAVYGVGTDVAFVPQETDKTIEITVRKRR